MAYQSSASNAAKRLITETINASYRTASLFTDISKFNRKCLARFRSFHDLIIPSGQMDNYVWHKSRPKPCNSGAIKFFWNTFISTFNYSKLVKLNNQNLLSWTELDYIFNWPYGTTPFYEYCGFSQIKQGERERELSEKLVTENLPGAGCSRNTQNHSHF